MTTNLALLTTTYTITRREHSLADKLIYTRKGAARLLRIEYEAIEFVYVADDYVLVGLYNTSVKLDKAEFKKLFVSDRKARSKSLTVTKHLNSSLNYTVWNEDNGHRYPVNLTSNAVRCECADYKKQMEVLPKSCCKHGYALLGQLGFTSLADYIESANHGALTNLSSTLCSTGLRGLYPKYDSYEAIKAEGECNQNSLLQRVGIKRANHIRGQHGE